MKTGIDAKSNVIPGEDPDTLETLAAEYHQRFRPATPEQRFLVDSLIEAEWKLRRFRKVEAHLWQSELEEGLRRERLHKKWPLGDLFSRNMTDLNGLQRRIDFAHRIYHRALEKLERLQAVPEPESPELAPEEPSRNQLLPSEIGFVPPIPPRPAEPMPISAPPHSPSPGPSAPAPQVPSLRGSPGRC
ncbi:MAG: hypothetical protein ABSC23_07605 [Bryobacteraceae bacterium]